jgi:fluoride ion exporter CrcB/FEX
MAALIDCIRAGILTIAILGTVAIGMFGVVFWQADAQSEARIWIRAGAVGCRLVTVSQGIGAEPCQS